MTVINWAQMHFKFRSRFLHLELWIHGTWCLFRTPIHLHVPQVEPVVLYLEVAYLCEPKFRKKSLLTTRPQTIPRRNWNTDKYWRDLQTCGPKGIFFVSMLSSKKLSNSTLPFVSFPTSSLVSYFPLCDFCSLAKIFCSESLGLSH